jgi:hypothetical protein
MRFRPLSSPPCHHQLRLRWVGTTGAFGGAKKNCAFLAAAAADLRRQGYCGGGGFLGGGGRCSAVAAGF